LMLFLDTDTLSYFLSGNSAVVDKMNKAINDNMQICLTSINVYEILKGLRYRSTKREEQKFYDFLKNITVFHMTDNSVKLAADIYASLRKRGITVSDADILIASLVITHNGKLITNNIKHYKSISNLIIENWFVVKTQ